MIRLKRRKNPAAVTETHPLATINGITVLMEWDEETESWVTHVPELNNISTFGKTHRQALDQTRDLILGYLETMRELRLPIPLAASMVRRLRDKLAA